MTSATAVLAVILWGTTALAPFTHAQGTQPDPGTLTDASLKEMLTNMGLEPKGLSKGYLIAVKRDDWTYNIQLVLSQDVTKLGFNANLGSVDNPDSVTADQWKGLLIQNKNVDPSAFYFDDDKKKVYIHRVLDNHGLTAAYLRGQIDNFCSNIKDTVDYWKFVK